MRNIFGSNENIDTILPAICRYCRHILVTLLIKIGPPFTNTRWSYALPQHIPKRHQPALLRSVSESLLSPAEVQTTHVAC